MEASRSFQTSVEFQRPTRHCLPEDFDLQVAMACFMALIGLAYGLLRAYIKLLGGTVQEDGRHGVPGGSHILHANKKVQLMFYFSIKSSSFNVPRFILTPL
jgi:hypothetical protein